MAISREEQLRNNRRFSRQIVGAVAIVLIIIGLFTVLSWVVGVLRSALDDTERRQSYAVCTVLSCLTLCRLTM